MAILTHFSIFGRLNKTPTMRNFLICLLFVASSGVVNAQTKIEWMTWQQAVEARKQAVAAGQTPKKMFIDVYTDWCGWCKKMDASTFVDPSVVAIMNAYYYPVKMDAEMPDSIIYDGYVFFNPMPYPAPGQRRGTHSLAASMLDGKLSYPSYVMFDENMNRSNIIQGYKEVQPLLGILLFFGTNQHVQYNQFMQQQQAAQQPQKSQPQAK